MCLGCLEKIPYKRMLMPIEVYTHSLDARFEKFCHEIVKFIKRLAMCTFIGLTTLYCTRAINFSLDFRSSTCRFTNYLVN